MNARNHAAARRRERGMTLIEIMVVITILGLLAAAVAYNVVGAAAKARKETAKSDIATITSGVETFKVSTGRFPTTEEGVAILIREKIIKPNKEGRLFDPWGHEYVYMYPGQAHPDSFDIKSYGADGQPGGDDENADVVNP